MLALDRRRARRVSGATNLAGQGPTDILAAAPNMNRTLKTIVSLLVGALALGATAACAATDTGTIAVSATVPNVCHVQSATVTFGSYDPLGANLAAPLDAPAAALQIACTGGTAWTVSLGSGQNFATSRQMRSAAGGLLGYELYSDAAHTMRWGDGSGGAAVVTGTAALTGLFTLQIYGRVPAGQTPLAGTYSDTVTATIVF